MKCELYQFTPEVYPFNLNAFDFLGEKVMKSEPFCYLVGWVAGKCEEVKKGKVRDKLIWENK